MYEIAGIFIVALAIVVIACGLVARAQRLRFSKTRLAETVADHRDQGAA